MENKKVEEVKNEEIKEKIQEILPKKVLPFVEIIQPPADPAMIERARTILILESQKEEETNLKMVWHVFNWVPTVTSSPFEWYELYKASFENYKIFRWIMMNIDENDFDDYINLIIHIRNCEREKSINPTKILWMVSTKTLSMLKDKPEIMDLVITEKKPIKQTTVMNWISNYL